MTEDEKIPPAHDSDGLLYDWFKHLTSLSMLTLGGVLTISQLPQADDIKKPVLTGILIGVAAAGVAAFSGAEQIVQARTTGTPLPRLVGFLQKAAPALLGMSVGAFLYTFVKAIN